LVLNNVKPNMYGGIEKSEHMQAALSKWWCGKFRNPFRLPNIHSSTGSYLFAMDVDWSAMTTNAARATTDIWVGLKCRTHSLTKPDCSKTFGKT
jgi:hypothetical protein